MDRSRPSPIGAWRLPKRCLAIAGAVSLAVVFLALAVAPISSAREPEGEQELLAFVRDAHRTSRESIQTCSCKVDFNLTLTRPGKDSEPKQTCSGQYWYARDGVRAWVTEHGRVTDHFWKDSAHKTVAYEKGNGQQATGAGLSRAPFRHSLRCDPWVRGLLVLNIPGTVDNGTFEELVDQAAKLKKAERRTVDGREMIVVKLAFDRANAEMMPASEVEIQFDPAANYLVRKATYILSRGYVHEHEVVQFNEVGPGLYFPERITGRSENDGKQDTSLLTTISDVRVNKPLPRDVFAFRFPNRVMLTDDIRNTQYRVDPMGNPTSKETPLGPRQPSPASQNAPATLGTVTEEEPQSLTRWILPVSLGILLVAAVAAYLRRRRGNTVDT